MALRLLHSWCFAACLLGRSVRAEHFRFEVNVVPPAITLIRTVYMQDDGKHIQFEAGLVNVTNSDLAFILIPWATITTGKTDDTFVGRCIKGTFVPAMFSNVLVFDYIENSTFSSYTNPDGPHILAIANCGAAPVHVSGRFSTGGPPGHEGKSMVDAYWIFTILFGLLAIIWSRTDASGSLRQDDIWHIGFCVKVCFLMALCGLIRFEVQVAAMEEIPWLDSIQCGTTVMSVTTLPVVYLFSSSNGAFTWRCFFLEVVMACCIFQVFRELKPDGVEKPSFHRIFPAVAICCGVLLQSACMSFRATSHLDEEEVEDLVFHRRVGLGSLLYASFFVVSAFAMALDDPRQGRQVWKIHKNAHALVLLTQFVGLLIVVCAWRRHLSALDRETKQPRNSDEDTVPMCGEEGGESAAVARKSDYRLCAGAGNSTEIELEGGFGGRGCLDETPSQ